MENWVSKRVRLIASGRERASSSPSVGWVGRRARKGVRVWIASAAVSVEISLGQKGTDTRVKQKKRGTFGLKSQDGVAPLHVPENDRDERRIEQ